MAKKAKYSVQLVNGNKQEVNGEIYGEWWGIHKNEDTKMYVLTHLESGRRVWSSTKKRTLQQLVQEPEFFEPPEVNSTEYKSKMRSAITRFCEENGWK